jgi:Family of unknown function (DUF6544)
MSGGRRNAMLWLALWIAVLVFGALDVVASARSLRFGRRVGREVRQLWAEPTEPRRIDRRRIAELPAPVRRYIARAVGERDRAVRTARLRHGGTFRTKLESTWVPIRGEQDFAADPPGFVWWGRVRVAPGLWFDARDRSVGGVGNMHASLESSVTVVDGSGPEIDQGALLRLLGEMVWLPTAFLDERHVTWDAVDARRARATLRVGGREVTAVFAFGEDGLPVEVLADRYRAQDGTSVLTPWSGQFGDYREVHGLLVPHRVIATWHVGGQPISYARFQVDRLEYDATTAF